MLQSKDDLSPGAGNGTPTEAIREWDNEHFMHPWEAMGAGDPDRPIAAGGV